ncbi:MAG: heme A synthase [Flavobacteriales bacterium]
MERRFLSLLRITLIFIYLVILAGSIVRMSGSGMGCPDWPKCFDCWVPPTDESQLPDNYKEIHSKKRAEKIESFARLLDRLGMDETADKLRNDKTLLQEENFNATKTWTEYINRLVGFITGNLVLLMVIFSLFRLRTQRSWFYLSLTNLIIISITAWFGAIVVATRLTPWVITVHMMLAVLLVLVQIYLLTRVSRPRYRENVPMGFRFLVLVALLLGFAQVYLGTQVRQEIDIAAFELGEQNRGSWMQETGNTFIVHRSFSILLLLLTAFLAWRNHLKHYGLSLLNMIFVLMVAEAIVGIIMAYAGMPKFAQPFHLFIGLVMLGLQYYVWLRSQTARL